MTLTLVISVSSWLLLSVQHIKVQNYRHPVYRLEVVFRLVLVIIYRLWLENNYLGNSAGADCVSEELNKAVAVSRKENPGASPDLGPIFAAFPFPEMPKAGVAFYDGGISRTRKLALQRGC